MAKRLRLFIVRSDFDGSLPPGHDVYGAVYAYDVADAIGLECLAKRVPQYGASFYDVREVGERGGTRGVVSLTTVPS